MSNIVKLGMVFDENSVPDFGGITFGKDQDLFLTSKDITKLDNITQTVCGTAFNIPTGTQAIVVDTADIFVYYSGCDAWHSIRRGRETKYGHLSVYVLNNNSKGYILGKNEKIVISVISNNSTVISKELYTKHYCGNGAYYYWINLEDAHKLYDLNDYTIDVRIYRGETDITNSLTIEFPAADEWYDAHVKYDTGIK